MIDSATLTARQHFADNCKACIDYVKRGRLQVNDREAFIVEQERLAKEHLMGKYDHTFTSRQYAHYLRTGESVPLLPKPTN